MTPKEKAMLLAIAGRDLDADSIQKNGRMRLLTAGALEGLGYLTIREAKGLYGLTVAKCIHVRRGAVARQLRVQPFASERLRGHARRGRSRVGADINAGT